MLCYTKQFLLQLVSQFCCDTSCALRYRLLESCYTRHRFSVILKAVVSPAAILSWNKTLRAQKEQFDWRHKLRHKLQGRCYTAQRGKNSLQRCETRCGKQNRLLLFATIAATKKLRQMSVAGYVTLGNISCNLCRNKTARQVAREIAQCNSALREDSKQINLLKFSTKSQ